MLIIAKICDVLHLLIAKLRNIREENEKMIAVNPKNLEAEMTRASGRAVIPKGAQRNLGAFYIFSGRRICSSELQQVEEA